MFRQTIARVAAGYKEAQPLFPKRFEVFAIIIPLWQVYIFKELQIRQKLLALLFCLSICQSLFKSYSRAINKTKTNR
jgi:hypothetical protein